MIRCCRLLATHCASYFALQYIEVGGLPANWVNCCSVEEGGVEGGWMACVLTMAHSVKLCKVSFWSFFSSFFFGGGWGRLSLICSKPLTYCWQLKVKKFSTRKKKVNNDTGRPPQCLCCFARKKVPPYPQRRSLALTSEEEDGEGVLRDKLWRFCLHLPSPDMAQQFCSPAH